MDPFNAPAIGDPRAVGSKFGSSSGTSTDIIFPVSKQVDSAFQPGRTLEFAFKSDQHRFWSPKNTRLSVDYELIFGETEETCSDVQVGPQDLAAPPSRSLRMTAMPNSTLFDSQVRFVANNTVIEQSNYYSDLCQAQLLTTSNIEGTNTSASGMLTSLRKDAGVPTGIMRGQQAKGTMGDGYELCPVVPAPYVVDDADGDYEVINDSTGVLNALKMQVATDTAVDMPNLNPVSSGKTIVIHLSSTEATAQSQVDAITASLTQPGHSLVVKTGDAVFKRPDGTLVDHTTITAKSPGFPAAAPYKSLNVGVEVADEIAATLAANSVLTVHYVTAAAGAPASVDAATLGSLAETLAVKVKSDVGKHTTPNPKALCLQQGYHPASKKSTVQVSEPVMLSSWAHPWAMGPGAYQLFLTISPNYLKDVLYDPSGQYGCPGRAGEAVMFGATDPTTIARNTVYVRIKDVSLHVAMIHPVEPYIPRSISIKTNPVTIAKRQLRTQTVQETFVVPPSTRSVLLFLTQDIHHICADFELDGRAKAGGGVNALGETITTSGPDYGKFAFDSRAQKTIRDAHTDPRINRTMTDYQPTQVIEVRNDDGSTVNLEKTAPHYWENLQIQLGQDVQPREQLAQQKPTTGEISRAWTLYTEFIAKSSGFRGSVMSFADFSGYLNANYNSGPRCGDRGVFHMFNIQNKSGSLSTDLQIRGSLSGSPDDSAKQFLVVMAVSESLFDISYTPPNPVPDMTRIQPLS